MVMGYMVNLLSHMRECQIFAQIGFISLHANQQYKRVFEVCYCCGYQRLWIPLVTLALSLPWVLVLREINCCSSPSCKPLLSLEALARWCRAWGRDGVLWPLDGIVVLGLGVRWRRWAFWIPPHFSLSTWSRYPLMFSVYVLEVRPPVN